VSKLLSSAEWLLYSQAALVGSPELLERISVVVTDSRQTQPDSLFVTLPGQKTQGWNFLEAAYQRGCRVFWAPEVAHQDLSSFIQNHRDVAYLLSVDPLKDLQHLAGEYLRRKSVAFRVGVTGSQGKTSVKEMLRVVLQTKGDTYATQGNLNSIYSLPCECLRIQGHHRFAVFEMGIDHVGEMEVLANLIRPQAAIITGIGTAHAEFLGGREGIAREKAKIASLTTSEDVFLVPKEDDFYHSLIQGVRAQILPYGLEDLDPGSLEVESWGKTRFRFKGYQVELPLGGRHFARNAVGVLKLADYLGLDLSLSTQALSRLELPPGRSRWIQGEITILDDSYNASLQSVEALLNTLKELPRPNFLILVLGSMLELGDLSQEAHQRIGSMAAQLAPDVLVWVGEEAHWGFEAAKRTYNGNHFWAKDVFGALEYLKPIVKPGHFLAVKGSRSINLDQIVNHFSQEISHVV
jgi:UDP-N-acetylmuramoyl-tripeptide--D-alanyl-D-alanine ligase